MPILFIPKKLRIGFRKNEKAMTDILAFVTYYNENGKLAQEVSFDNWRDGTIPFIEIDNTPQSGYLINSAINHIAYDFGKDRVRFRVHSPLDFEFEITPLNVEYILTVCDISKREISEECVFAWSGRELVLVPTSSEQYREALGTTERIENFKKLSKESLKSGLNKMDFLKNKKDVEFVYWGEQSFLTRTDLVGMKREWFTLENDKWVVNMPLKKRHVGFKPHLLANGSYFIPGTVTLESFAVSSHEKLEKTLQDCQFSEHSELLEVFVKNLDMQLTAGAASNVAIFPNIGEDQKVLTFNVQDYNLITKPKRVHDTIMATLREKSYKSIKGFYINSQSDVIDIEITDVDYSEFKATAHNSRTGETVSFSRLTGGYSDKVHPMLEIGGLFKALFLGWEFYITSGVK